MILKAYKFKNIIIKIGGVEIARFKDGEVMKSGTIHIYKTKKANEWDDLFHAYTVIGEKSNLGIRCAKIS